MSTLISAILLPLALSGTLPSAASAAPAVQPVKVAPAGLAPKNLPAVIAPKAPVAELIRIQGRPAPPATKAPAPRSLPQGTAMRSSTASARR